MCEQDGRLRSVWKDRRDHGGLPARPGLREEIVACRKRRVEMEFKFQSYLYLPSVFYKLLSPLGELQIDQLEWTIMPLPRF